MITLTTIITFLTIFRWIYLYKYDEQDIFCNNETGLSNTLLALSSLYVVVVLIVLSIKYLP